MNIEDNAAKLEALGAKKPAEWVLLLGRRRESEEMALQAETINDWLYGYECAVLGTEVAALIEEIRVKIVEEEG